MLTTTTASTPVGSDIALKRRRGRPSKSTAASHTIPENVVTTIHFLGYSLHTEGGNISVHSESEEVRGSQRTIKITPTHIRIPSSQEHALSDEAFQNEIIGYAQRIRHELGQRDNYKLHLQKDAPDHVYFSYSIDGAPTTTFFVHPSRVDISPQAFESIQEQESFLNAVRNQNFSNKAYKKWREAVRDQFLDEVISHELVQKFGNDAERKDAQRAQSVAMHGHGGAKKAVIVPATHTQESVAPVIAPEVVKSAPLTLEAPEVLPELPKEDQKPLLLEVPHTPVVTVAGGEGVVASSIDTPLRTPVKKQKPRVTITPQPPPMSVSIIESTATLPEYIQAKKAYLAAAQVLKPFEGIVGSFRKEFQHDEYVRQVKRYRETKERYDKARHDYSVFVVTRHIAALLGAIALDASIQSRLESLTYWVFQGQAAFSKTRIGHLVTAERYEQYEEWLRHANDNLDMQLECRTLLNTVTLEGFTIAALLGIPLNIPRDRDPNQTVRIAAAASADLAVLREGLRASFGIEACRVPEMSFSQRRTLEDMADLSHMRNMVTMLEFHARLRGEILSMERHHTSYCDLYAQLYEKYAGVVSNPEGTVSVAHALGKEKASIALVEHLLRQGKTLKEYAGVKSDGMKFLDAVAGSRFPENLHELSRVFALSRWSGTAMGERARQIWDAWHDKGAIEKAGMTYIELNHAETLLGALRRVVWAHGDLFPGQEAGEQKVYMTLRQVYLQMGFTTVPENPRQWLRLGNAGDRVYVDANGQIWYANTSGREAGFLEMDEFEGFIQGTPEYVLWKLVHDESEEVFMEYIKDFNDVFLNYYEKKIDLLPESGRTALRHRLEGLTATDHDSREEAESFFRDFYNRHHGDAIEKGKE